MRKFVNTVPAPSYYDPADTEFDTVGMKPSLPPPKKAALLVEMDMLDVSASLQDQIEVIMEMNAVD